jgi:hypothetical protein
MSDSVASATRTSSTGTAISTAMAALIVVATLVAPFFCSSPASESLAALWKDRALNSRPLFISGFVFMTFGLLFCAAAPAIPWIAGSVSASVYVSGTYVGATAAWTITGLMVEISTCAEAYYNTGWPNALCRSESFVNFFTMIGSALIYAGLALFIFPAWAMAFAATRSVMQLSSQPVMPPMGCCLPSLPAIQGCGWFGLIIVTIGGAMNWSLRAAYGYFAGGSAMAGAGGNLLGVGVFCLFLANILFAIATCCKVGNLPGIGRARKDCCCGERELLGPNGEAPGATAGAVPAAVEIVSGAVKTLHSDECMRSPPPPPPARLPAYYPPHAPAPLAFQPYSTLTAPFAVANPLGPNPVAAPARANSHPPPPKRLPAGWEELRTSEGEAYYYNSVTDSTSWERPA